MEIGYIVNELWRRKQWLAVGLLVATFAAAAVVYDIPSFEKKSLELGAANTQLLVDSQQSPIGALNTPIDVLIVRSALYARLIQSNEVRLRVAKELGVPVGMISTQGPQPGVENERGAEVSAPRRANDLVTEGSIYRIVATPGGEIPIVVLSAQAKTPEEAIRVADATANALQAYVLDVQERQNIDEDLRVELRQLGPAQGGLVNEGVDLAAAFLAFVGAFGLWCVLVLLTPRVLMGLREGQAAWHAFPGTEAPSDGTNGREPFDAETVGAVENGSEPPDDARERTTSPG